MRPEITSGTPRERAEQIISRHFGRRPGHAPVTLGDYLESDLDDAQIRDRMRIERDDEIIETTGRVVERER